MLIALIALVLISAIFQFAAGCSSFFVLSGNKYNRKRFIPLLFFRIEVRLAAVIFVILLCGDSYYFGKSQGLQQDAGTTAAATAAASNSPATTPSAVPMPEEMEEVEGDDMSGDENESTEDDLDDD